MRKVVSLIVVVLVLLGVVGVPRAAAEPVPAPPGRIVVKLDLRRPLGIASVVTGMPVRVVSSPRAASSCSSPPGRTTTGTATPPTPRTGRTTASWRTTWASGPGWSGPSWTSR